MRQMWMCSTANSLPVGGLPRNSPRWRPCIFTRATTLSFSTISSSISARIGPQRPRSQVTVSLRPSGPCGLSGGASWLMKSGWTSSSAAARLPRSKSSSRSRRAIRLFASDISLLSIRRGLEHACGAADDVELAAGPGAGRDEDDVRDAEGDEGGAPVGELVGGLTGLEAGAECLVDRVVVAAEVVAVAGEHVQLVADRPAAVGMSKRLQASAYRATSRK